MLSREQGHPLSLESPALPLTAPPSTGRAGRPKCAGRVCRRTEPSRRSVASRARLGQVTPARPAAPPSPGLRAPFRTPKAPALACGRSAPRARLRLDSGRAGCGLSHRGPLPQRPAPVCLGAPSFIEGTAESTGFPCTASAKPPSPAQRSPTRICWSKVKSPFVSRTLGDTV